MIQDLIIIAIGTAIIFIFGITHTLMTDKKSK